MHITKLDETLSVASQIAPEAMTAIRDAGFRAIICNRPDGEEAGQPSFAEIKAAAQKAGLQARHVPLAGGAMPHQAAGAFAAAMKDLPAPVLAYCRSGARSSALYQLSQSMA